MAAWVGQFIILAGVGIGVWAAIELYHAWRHDRLIRARLGEVAAARCESSGGSEAAPSSGQRTTERSHHSDQGFSA